MWLWAGLVLVGRGLWQDGRRCARSPLDRPSWRDAIALAALLSTGGLVELIVLNIAYSVGACTPTLFTMLVVMALITTMLTTPILTSSAYAAPPGSSPAPYPSQVR